MICEECGMACEPREFHPFAACLLFKQTKDAAAVRANLAAVIEYGRQLAASDSAEGGAA